MYLLRGPGQGETAPLAFERPENALRVQLLQDAPQVRVGKTEFPRKLLAGHPPGVIAGDVKEGLDGVIRVFLDQLDGLPLQLHLTEGRRGMDQVTFVATLHPDTHNKFCGFFGRTWSITFNWFILWQVYPKLSISHNKSP